MTTVKVPAHVMDAINRVNGDVIFCGNGPKPEWLVELLSSHEKKPFPGARFEVRESKYFTEGKWFILSGKTIRDMQDMSRSPTFGLALLKEP